MDPADRMIGQQAELLASRRPGREEKDTYERVLGDAMSGDPTLSAREDYLEGAWRIVDRVPKANTPFHEYAAGTWGSNEVEKSVAPSGGWQDPTVT
jgi:glucose-6-phosphate 1-dehydrogenase